MLQFITNTEVELDVTQQVREVLAGGCKWVQLRMKDSSDDDIREIVNEIKPFCKDHDAILILNDRVELAKELEVDGVHLGKTDMKPEEARLILGSGAIIGVTVNTFEDVDLVKNLDIDYIGIGPFRKTSTKKNLAPILGIEGYQNIIEKMRTAEIEIPAVAVGGISFDDIGPLFSAGINGVAVSGAIASAESPERATKKFLSIISNIIQ